MDYYITYARVIKYIEDNQQNLSSAVIVQKQEFVREDQN